MNEQDRERASTSPRTLSKTRRTPVNYGAIVDAVNKVLNSYNARMTLRQIYYRLVSINLIPNTKTSYKTLSKQLVKARERGHVDETRIEDHTRTVLGAGDVSDYDSKEDFIRYQLQRVKSSGSYWTAPLWKNQAKKVFVVVEKDALSRLFSDVASGYLIQVYPEKGYASFTFLNDMAADLDETKENVILYFGDYDPSGRDIERDMGERLARYSKNGGSFSIRRIALTRDQISEYKLPPKPEDAETLAKIARDPRSAKYGTEFVVELDALEPDVLKSMIKAAILSEIDLDHWNRNVEAIEETQGELNVLFKDARIILSDGTEIREDND